MKNVAICVPYPTQNTEALYFSVFHSRLCDILYYLQVHANPQIRFAEWSGDKNLYCMANTTTCGLCVLSHAPSLLEDKYIFTRALVEIQI